MLGQQRVKAQEGSKGSQMTISEQHCIWSKYNCYLKSYVVKSAKHGVQSSTKGKGAFEGGRKVGFLHQHLTGDAWVLNTIAGYQIPFKGEPEQARRPPEAVFSQRNKQLYYGRKFSLCYRKVPSSHS